MFQKFLADLQQALKRLPLEDREKISAYYTELYFDKKDCGQSEEDILISFGNIGLIAERILRENPNRIEGLYSDSKPPLNFGQQTYSSNAQQNNNTTFDSKVFNEYSKTQQTQSANSSTNVDNQNNNNSKSFLDHSYIESAKQVYKDVYNSPVLSSVAKFVLTLLSIGFAICGLAILCSIVAIIYEMIQTQSYLLFSGIIAIVLGISFIFFGFSSLCAKKTKRTKNKK